MKRYIHCKASAVHCGAICIINRIQIYTGKPILIMKITAVILLVATLQVSASGYAQKLSIHQNNSSLKNVLNVIRKQTGYFFIFNKAVVQKARPVSINADNRDLKEVLTELLKDQHLSFEIREKVIVITNAAASSAVPVIRTEKAPPVNIKGRVLDAKGLPLIGASVRVKGSAKGTVTDVNGNFALSAIETDAVLLISFSGFVTQEIPVNGRTEFNVGLKEDIQSLSDVVVVGYGTQSKRAVTGSVTSVNYDKFKDRSFSNVTQALAGQLPGVNISQSQGAPGSSPVVRIRGTSSITAGTNPLYVIDGLPVENFNLNLINPQDISSVEVLKDASSAAIYGSRGANGVIIITTKLGKAGITSVNASYEFGVQTVNRQIDMMNAQQFVQYYVDAHNNAWVAAGGKASDPNSVRGSAYKIPEDFTANPQQFGQGTDWQDVMFNTALSHNAQLSVSGGSDKTQFLVSAAYLDQDAVLDQNYYKRLALRLNLKHQISDRLTLGANISLTSIYDRTDGTLGKADVVSLGVTSDPIFPVYNENGNLGFRDPNSSWYRFTQYSDLQLWNPYGMTREIQKQNKTYNTLATGYAEYRIIDGLKFRTSINANLSNARYSSYQNALQKYGYSSAGPAIANNNTTSVLNWLSENTLNYEKQLDKHKITALLGYTAQHQRDEFADVSGSNFPNDLVPTLNAGTITGGTSIASEWALLSYLGRVNYSYKDKYFLTGTLRRDGSSRFGENNKYGYFPSASAGWLVSDEDFMKDKFKWVSSLKLRASYGIAGNNQIPNYGSIGLLSASNYVYGSTVVNGLSINNISNRDLKWEKTTQYNAGIDMAMFNSRLNLTLDAYYSVTKDLLLNVPVPDITGFANQLSNIGRMRNQGFEIGLSSKNLIHAFTWTTDFNFSLNRNKVLQLGPNNAPLNYNDFSVAVRTEVGQPVSNYYGYIFDGVYQNQAQINGSPHDPTTTPGDPIVRDVNGDGKITADDRTNIGNYQPKFISGITNTFGYKGLEFSLLLQGSYGGKIANQLVRYSGLWNGGRNAYEDAFNYWRSEASPGDGKHFKPTVEPKGLQNQFSSYWIEDGSFLRVKNIRLSYALPKSVLTKMRSLKSVRLYVNAENVFLFSKYTNYDPENTTYAATTYSPTATAVSTIPTGAFLGVDYGSYPVPRVVTFGIKADF
jgi:TonB-linked SusC/RagA family outer membrane protein